MIVRGMPHNIPEHSKKLYQEPRRICLSMRLDSFHNLSSEPLKCFRSDSRPLWLHVRDKRGMRGMQDIGSMGSIYNLYITLFVFGRTDRQHIHYVLTQSGSL